MITDQFIQVEELLLIDHLNRSYKILFINNASENKNNEWNVILDMRLFLVILILKCCEMEKNTNNNN